MFSSLAGRGQPKVRLRGVLVGLVPSLSLLVLVVFGLRAPLTCSLRRLCGWRRAPRVLGDVDTQLPPVELRAVGLRDSQLRVRGVAEGHEAEPARLLCRPVLGQKTIIHGTPFLEELSELVRIDLVAQIAHEEAAARLDDASWSRWGHSWWWHATARLGERRRRGERDRRLGDRRDRPAGGSASAAAVAAASATESGTASARAAGCASAAAAGATGIGWVSACGEATATWSDPWQLKRLQNSNRDQERSCQPALATPKLQS